MQRIKGLSKEIQKHLVFIVLPFIIGLALAVILYLNANSIQKKYGDLTLSSFQSSITSIMSQIELSALNLQTSLDKEWSAEISGNTASSKFTICDLLDQYKSDCFYISEIYLFNENQDFIFTSEGHFSYQSADSFFSRLGIAISKDEHLDPAYLPDGWHSNNNGVFSPYYSLYLSSDSSLAGTFIVITMNRSLLLQLMQESDYLLCCIYDEESSICSLFLPSVVDWSVPSQISSLIGEPVKCFYSSDENYNYLIAISSLQYYLPLYTVILLFALYLIIVLLINVINVSRQSRQRYALLNSLLEIISVPADDTYSEESARDTIADVLENYITEKDLMADTSKSQNLSLILSDMSQTDFLPEQYDRAGIASTAESFCVVTFHVKDYSMIDMIMPLKEDNEENVISLIQVMLQTVLKSYASDDYMISCTSYNCDFCAVFSFPRKPDSYDALTDIVHKVLITVENTYEIKIIACISNFIDTPEDLSNAFWGNYHLYHLSQTIGSNADIILQKDYSADMEMLLRDNYLQQISMLINALLSQNYNIIPQLICAISENTSPTDEKNHVLAASRLSCIANILAEAAMNSTLSQKNKEQLLNSLLNVSSMMDLHAIAIHYAELMEDLTNNETRDPVQNACNYIQDHFSDPNLNVPEICEAVGFSVQHMSKLFRQRLDQTITEYINNIRIEQAKKLLLETKLTVAVIGENVGYSSSLTFTRNFKKNVGMTPNEFRQIYIS